MVDKYAVKKYVADIIGEEYIIRTLGVWDKPEDIDWNSLPILITSQVSLRTVQKQRIANPRCYKKDVTWNFITIVASAYERLF